MVKKPDNTVWVGLEYFCSENDDMWNMSDEDFITFAIDELDKIQVINKNDVLDSVRIKVKKAYPAYFGTYKNFPVVREYLDSTENLYCIGRNGMHRYNNMDHSMVTAMRCADHILGKIQNKEEIWQVNTDKEYHEEKSSEAQ